jgi:hypothetical protein
MVFNATCYIMAILFYMLWSRQENTIKKTLFDLEVKSQGHRKVIIVRDTPPYGHAPTYQISLTYASLTNLINNVVSSNKGVLIADIYIRTTVYINLKNIPHSPEGTLGYHAPTYQISLTYLERNNYLTLRSKVKVTGRSLWYATHRLMVMHPHTKYH